MPVICRKYACAGTNVLMPVQQNNFTHLRAYWYSLTAALTGAKCENRDMLC